jgi:hypothetical protein
MPPRTIEANTNLGERELSELCAQLAPARHIDVIALHDRAGERFRRERFYPRHLRRWSSLSPFSAMAVATALNEVFSPMSLPVVPNRVRRSANQFKHPSRLIDLLASIKALTGVHPETVSACEDSNGNRPMPKKFTPIPAVPFELIVKGHEGVTSYRERHEQADPTVALVTTLADSHSPEDIMAVSYRLGALAKLIRDGEGGKWTIPVLNQEYRLVNESLFRAAARAPLFEARTVGQVSFDPETFLKIALEESAAEGSA